MPATWPLGTYSMPKPVDGCLTGYMEGSISMAQSLHTEATPKTNLDGRKEIFGIVKLCR